MRVAARIYQWIIISVILQVLVLTYVNNFYLNSGGNVKATMVEVEETKPQEKQDLKLPAGADRIGVSYDGCYVSYILDNKLEIADIKTHKVIKTLAHDKLSYSYYKWLPDRNMVIYSLKASSDQPGEVHIYTYDVESELERNYPKVGNLPKGSEVTDIELSPLTNVVYAKIKQGAAQYRICKFDIMDTLSYVMNTSSDIVIKEAGYSDILVYQDDKNKLFIRDGLKYSVKELPFKSKMVLMGIDGEDRIFAGEVQADKKVGLIYYGKPNEDVGKQWKKIPVSSPVEPDDLILTPGGVIYRKAEQESAIYNIESGRKVSYKGKLIEVTDGFIVYLDKNTLKVDPIKD